MASNPLDFWTLIITYYFFFSFFLQGVLHMGSLRGISFGSRMIKEREEEETCICAPVVIGKKIYKYLLKVGIRIQRMIEFFLIPTLLSCEHGNGATEFKII